MVSNALSWSWLHYLQKISDVNFSDTFSLISDNFRTKILDTALKHALSKFTTKKHELDWNKIYENDNFTAGYTIQETNIFLSSDKKNNWTKPRNLNSSHIMYVGFESTLKFFTLYCKNFGLLKFRLVLFSDTIFVQN